MYLKRLEIYGFKSFGAKSVLDFVSDKERSKIAAIVGPNGSGKSNVADAVRWVLGEQSSKLLRSKKGEDVIFVGSSTKARSSYAEVSVTLASQEPFLIELNNKKHTVSEIEISRKIYRSGESEYLINRKKVRLLDLTQALAALGFGQSSYTVIGQGMVDRLLFFNAAERKVLFDEAAGVKQYEIKREQAIKKLEATDGNLVRLRDILTELEPRVVNLRRLVKRAEGRAEAEKELASIQNEYYSSIVYEYSSQIEKLQNEKSALTGKIEARKKEIVVLNEEIAGKNSAEIKESEITAIEKGITEATEARDEYLRKVAYIEGQMTLAGQKEENAMREQEKLLSEKGELTKKIDFLESRIREQDRELKEEVKKREQIAGLCSEMAEESSSLQRKIETLSGQNDEAGIESLKEKIAEREEKRREISKELFSLNQEEKSREIEGKRNETRRSEIENQVKRLEAEIEGMNGEIKSSKKRQVEIDTGLGEKESEQRALTIRIEKAGKELEAFVSQIDKENLAVFEKELSSAIALLQSFEAEISEGKKVTAKIVSFFDDLKNIFPKVKLFAKSLNQDERARIEGSLLTLKNDFDALTKATNTLAFEKVRIVSGIELLGQRVDQAKNRRSELLEEIDEINANPFVKVGKEQISSLERELSKINSDIDELSEALRDKAKSFSEKSHEIVSGQLKLKEEESAQRKQLYELELAIGKKKNTIENQRREIQLTEERIGEIELKLLQTSAFSDKKEEELEVELSSAKKELESRNLLLAGFRQELSTVLSEQRATSQAAFETEKRKRGFEDEVVSYVNEINGLNLEETKYQTRLEDLKEELRVTGNVIGVTRSAKILEQEEKDGLRVKMENLRRKLETIGGVDPETVAEYEELDARNQETITQVGDLESAKEDLEKVIFELDSKIKKQFSDVFGHIATEFDRHFKILFGGGKADLSLGEDEEGNFGIEIMVNPPGKKTSGLSVLSGGEKTLTSLALLFAILSINPSPFCVLDEVDAALDESNTLRFAKIIQDLAHKTQFLVISHNRETMKAADSLFGITIDNDQLSKIISVRLTEALEAVKK